MCTYKGECCDYEDRRLGFSAIAGLIAVVLIDGPLRWLAFGETLMTGFIALGLVVVLALGWGENKPAEIND